MTGRMGSRLGKRGTGRTAAVFVIFVLIAGGPLVLGVSSVTLTQFEYVLSMAMVVIGLNVVIGYAGQLYLGPGAISGVAGYAAAIVAAHSIVGGGLVPMLVVGVVAAAVTGLLIGVPALRVGGFYLGMTTLLLAAAVPVVASNLNITGRTGGILLLAVPNFTQTPSGTSLYVLVVAVVFVLVVLSWAVRHSRMGRRFVALRSSEELASALGVSGYRTKLLAFLLAAIPAGIGGVFYVFSQQTMSPGSTSATLSVYILAAAVIGGLGTVLGPIVGAAIVLGISQFLGGLAQYEGIFYGFLLILVVELVPEGLVGSRSRFAAAWRHLFPRRRSLFSPAVRAQLEGLFGAGVSRTGTGGTGRSVLDAAPATPPATVPATAPEAAPEAAAAAAPANPRVPGGQEGPALEVSDASKAFGGVRAVDGVSLTVRRGQLAALIGPNGSGKTTLINMITGFYRPDEGTIRVGDLQLERSNAAAIARAGVVRTFQTPKLMVEDTVLENVMVAADRVVPCRDLESVLRVGRGRRAQRASRAQAVEALSFLGIERYSDEIAGEVPHGIQRLIEMARAVAVQPRFLLLDEPAAGLTPGEVDALMEAIRAVAESSGVGVLLVEHNVRVVLELAQDITVLHRGRCIAQGPPATVRNDPEVVRVFLGTAQQAAGGQS
ncbi:MAG: branched-chain amino acid ABC transporter ATP-binding protein/permease [Acidimicrobiales bacterium]